MLTDNEMITEIEPALKKLKLKAGDICVLTGTFTHAQLRSILSIKDVPRVPVIVLNEGQTIASADEATMKRLGWIKAQA